MKNKITLFRGKEIETLSKQELIEMVNCLFEYYEARIVILKKINEVDDIIKTTKPKNNKLLKHIIDYFFVRKVI
ncbi:MAG: hypothetical protein HGB12_02940 [Bacteroidetes bacterium]|nr:hypothetical protein [Bacteroidota bacterium]